MFMGQLKGAEEKPRGDWLATERGQAAGSWDAGTEVGVKRAGPSVGTPGDVIGKDCPGREGWLGKGAGPTGLTPTGPNGRDCDTATNKRTYQHHLLHVQTTSDALLHAS